MVTLAQFHISSDTQIEKSKWEGERKKKKDQEKEQTETWVSVLEFAS